MEEYVRKLTLWDTKRYKPITRDEELEPIMEILGFVAHPILTSSSPRVVQSWKEYKFSAEDAYCDPCSMIKPPHPRLPYPRIDGLHVYTYQTFCDAVGFYIGNGVIAEYLHVRAMPLQLPIDRMYLKSFRQMSEDDRIHVYREESLDAATVMHCNENKKNARNPESETSNVNDGIRNYNMDNIIIRNRWGSVTTSIGRFVTVTDTVV